MMGCTCVPYSWLCADGYGCVQSIIHVCSSIGMKTWFLILKFICTISCMHLGFDENVYLIITIIVISVCTLADLHMYGWHVCCMLTS